MCGLKDIIKYALIAVILAGLLYFMPNNNMNEETIIKLVLIALIVIFIVENFIFSRREGMASISGINYTGHIMPTAYNYGTEDEDYIEAKLRYDWGLPGYYLIQNGRYVNGTVPNDHIKDTINESVWHNLYKQYDFDVGTVPHHDLGKGRGYLNWDKLQEGCL